MPKRKTLLIEVEPQGGVTEAASPYPVLVTLRYAIGLGEVHDHPAVAVAWTEGEVLVRWGAAEVWLPLEDVRRAGTRS